MITLITGKPGDGKTLLTVDWVQQQAEKEGRTVYYDGIKDLKLPWVQLADPKEWFNCPKGSIIVMDEAQRIFRLRGYGSQVPPAVAELETHRHSGFDLYLVTQNPLLIDPHVRRLVGRHLHQVRRFGTQTSVVHEWGRVKEDCDKPGGRQDSIRHEYIFPKGVYGHYQSAEIHTHKARLPMRYVFLFVAPFLVVGLGYYAFKRLSDSGIAPPKTAGAASDVKGKVGRPGGSGGPGRGPVEVTPAEFVASRVARVQDFPESAPIYDGLAVPKSFPYVTGCISAKGRCSCYTGQGTRLAGVSKEMCASFVLNGAFDHYRVYEAVQRSAPGRAVPAAVEAPVASVAAGAVPVASAAPAAVVAAPDGPRVHRSSPYAAPNLRK